MKSPVILAAGLTATAAFAQTPPAPTPANVGAGELNQIVCRTIRETGSRLRLRRVCVTRAEWDLRKLERRRGLELLQMQRHSATL